MRYRIINYKHKKFRVERLKEFLLAEDDWFPVGRNGQSIGEEWWDGYSFDTVEEAEEFIKWINR